MNIQIEITKRLSRIIQRNDAKKSENMDNSFDFNGFNEGKTLGYESRLKAEDKPQTKYKKLDDEIFEDMQRQLYLTDSLKDKSIEEITEEDLDRIMTPQHRESVRKLGELLDN